METFDPSAYHTFMYDGYTHHPDGKVVCRWSLHGKGQLHFVEEYQLGALSHLTPERYDALEGVIRLLWLAAGLSYYKTAAADVVVVAGGLTARESVWLEKLYREGLGEYAYENSIDLNEKPILEAEVRQAGEPVTGLGLERRSLVAVGGGKDSCVSIDILSAAGEEILLFNVNGYRAALETATTAALPLKVVHRTLDPQLKALNATGALNGHVPVTAVVSLAAVASAIVTGCDRVVFSNERSADTPNLEAHGLPVNHQYSKSSVAEALLRDVIREVTPEVEYYSLLRPLSELQIAELFARSGRFLDVFTSCNVAFKLDEDQRTERWCGHCPKCHFVFLVLAPFVEKDKLLRVFAGDLLSDPEQLPGYRELLGLSGHKPFECVGEIEESRVALHLLESRPEWAESHVPLLVRELREKGLAATEEDVIASLAPQGRGNLPADAQSALERALQDGPL